jgi:hypothetical protein
VLLSIHGNQTLGWSGAGFEGKHISVTCDWLKSKAKLIDGGTSEVQLNAIVKSVLGLPD